MTDPLRVACIGMGWWSDVLADAIKRSSQLKIVACYSRSEQKRAAFAAKMRFQRLPCSCAFAPRTNVNDNCFFSITNLAPCN